MSTYQQRGDTTYGMVRHAILAAVDGLGEQPHPALLPLAAANAALVALLRELRACPEDDLPTVVAYLSGLVGKGVDGWELDVQREDEQPTTPWWDRAKDDGSPISLCCDVWLHGGRSAIEVYGTDELRWLNRGLGEVLSNSAYQDDEVANGARTDIILVLRGRSIAAGAQS